MDKIKFVTDNIRLLHEDRIRDLSAEIMAQVLMIRYGIKFRPDTHDVQVWFTKLRFPVVDDATNIYKNLEDDLIKLGLTMEHLKIWQSYSQVHSVLNLYRTDEKKFHGDTFYGRILVDFVLWLHTGNISTDMTEAGEIWGKVKDNRYGVPFDVAGVKITMYKNNNIRFSEFTTDMEHRWEMFNKAKQVFK